jgi:hypothetical protein
MTRSIIAAVLFAFVVRMPAFAQDQQPFRQMVADLPPRGFSLRSDGLGKYHEDSTSSLVVEGHYGIALCMDRSVCSTLPESPPTKPGDRRLSLDFSKPVPGSGSVDRRVVLSANANFGAFWGQDTTRKATYNGRVGWVLRSLLDLPIDSTISSERVEVRFFIKGAQHVLQFGPWVAGQYQPRQGPFHGNGTTRALITRTTPNRWVIRSGPNSVGRLWDNSNPSHPRDLGLYSFSYEVVFEGR